jgi:hypothetical protein
LPSSSNPTEFDPKLEEMNRTLKSLTSEIDKMKWETKHPNRPYQDVGNRNTSQFRRTNNAPRLMQRERRNVEDQRVVPPFQNNEIEEMDAENDVVDDSTVLFNETDIYPSHLTQQDYEISQLSIQFEDDVKEEEIFQSQPQKKYDLRPRLGGPQKNSPI